MSHFTKILSLAVFGFMFAISSQAYASKGVGFHFYGAENCFPCVAFKTRHLEGVQEHGEKSGFTVHANMIDRTIDIKKVGIYGEADPLLRLAGPELRRIYPPVFFVTKGDEIYSVHGGDWKEALDSALKAVN